MRIQTVYKDGVLKPVKPLRFRQQMVTISIFGENKDIAEEVQFKSHKTAFERFISVLLRLMRISLEVVNFYFDQLFNKILQLDVTSQ